MEIDFSKCYNAMSSSVGDTPIDADKGFVRQAIKQYVTAYHRQLEESLEPLFMHYHRMEGATQSKTGSPYLCNEPKPETCDCEGRKRLEKAGWLERERDGRWYHIMPWRDDRTKRSNLMLRETCPLCDKLLP